MSNSFDLFAPSSKLVDMEPYRIPATRRIQILPRINSFDTSESMRPNSVPSTPNLNRFFHNRMNSSSSFDLPGLDISTSSEDEDDEMNLSSPTFSNKYQSSSSKINFDYTSLDQIPPPKLLQSIKIPFNPCSSCGIESISSKRPFVQLEPCQHLLCSGCVNSLVNATSNDPPRIGNCFACEGSIVNFIGVEFITEAPASVSFTPPRFTRIGDSISTLSPARKLDWSTDLSNTSSNSSPAPSGQSSTKKSINQGSDFAVVRIDNVPWGLSIAQVEGWLPKSVNTIPFEISPLSIHILCNRIDGKTLNQLYIELPTLEDAHTLIQLRNGKKITSRPVSVGLSSQIEMMQQIFPECNFSSSRSRMIRAIGGEELLISNQDLDGLVHLCNLETAHPLRCPERPFLNFVSILIKISIFVLWKETELELEKQAGRIYDAIETALTRLIHCEPKFSTEIVWRQTIKIMISASLACSAFRSTQKNRLMEIAELADTPITPPSTSTSSNFSLKSPTFDRVRSTDSSPSPPPRYSIPSSYASTTPSPIRLNSNSIFRPKLESFQLVGEDDKREVELIEMAERLGVGLEVVKSIVKEFKK